MAQFNSIGVQLLDERLFLNKTREFDLIDGPTTVRDPYSPSRSFTQYMHNALCYFIRPMKDKSSHIILL